jgi:tetratricopeptide (TPR) repeat protein
MAIFAEIQLARISKDRGNLDQAEVAVERIIDASERNGFTTNAFEARCVLIECMIRRGKSEQAIAELDRVVAAAGDEAAMFTLTEARLRATALGRIGRTEEARRLLDEGIATARDVGQRYDEALLLAAKASIVESTDPASARTCGIEAERVMDALGIRVRRRNR